ncbi:MAG: type secretion system protein ImpG [Thermoanaerobaculia bacterium]|jgi:type VI secretion system protein ImpG|nr:type secretion system protein ImpG [Thermoanaerobaculia bacterium]
MTAIDDQLLGRYLEEISYLRSMGVRFARDNGKIAGRLELGANVSPDPHVERLIESFAFLTARIQRDLANDFPEIAAELLQTLYPHYLNPIPPMTIVRFVPNPKQKLPDDALIKRGTPLFIHTKDKRLRLVPPANGESVREEGDDICRFRTCYPVSLWPIEVEDATIASGFDFRYTGERRPAAVLRLRLRTVGDASGDIPFDALQVDTLRFFINNESLVNGLYPLLLGGNHRKVSVVAPDSIDIPREHFEIAPVGFGDDEDVIYTPRLSHPAYRLLQEYFAFEQKFHFFDVKGLRGKLHGTRVDLLFLLDEEPPASAVVHRDAFLLGCTPAINLFPRTSEPIRVTHQSIEYPLVADYRRNRSTKIHSVSSVSGSSNAAATSRQYAPFYSFTRHMEQKPGAAFWHSRRDGDDVFLSFRDSGFDPTLPGDEVVWAHVLCTNGDYASQIDAGLPLESDEETFGSKAVVLHKPTPPLLPPAGGELLWRLVSHLSLNHLSISGDDALPALREILLLYCPASLPIPRRRIDGIRKVSSRKMTHRVASAWNGFARGTEVTLVFDARLLSENGFLFASVLSHFFALHASINSFSQVVVHRDDEGDGRSRDQKGMRWPVMIGAKAVL